MLLAVGGHNDLVLLPNHETTVSSEQPIARVQTDSVQIQIQCPFHSSSQTLFSGPGI